MFRIRVSDIVTTDKVRSWKDGDIITITAKTGDGKSYFVKNELYDYAKKNDYKILFLIHRKETLKQFQLEIERDQKHDVIEMMTYQKIEYKIREGYETLLNNYDYIVCDEYHYWLESDAQFNKFTDLSLNAVMKAKGIKILMSATADRTKAYIKENFNKTIDYELPIDYKHIKTLGFYNKDETLNEFMKLAIEQNKKAIFFIESAKKAYDLHKRYTKHTVFNCSESNTYYKYVDEKAIKEILETEKLLDDKKILITTMTMSTGINIKDEELRDIVIDCKDIDIIIQCIGRKRSSDKDDKVNVLIKSISNQQLGGILTSTNKKIEMVQYFKDYGVQMFLKKYPRESDRLNILYDVIENGKLVKKLNMLMYARYLMDIVDIEKMLGKYKNKDLKITYAFPKFVARRLKFWDEETNEYDYYVWEEEKNNDDLEEYLESVVGKVFLQTKDRKDLIEKINVRQNGKLLKSINSLNSALEERKINYYIREFETSRVIDGKKKKFKSAWKVMRLGE